MGEKGYEAAKDKTGERWRKDSQDGTARTNPHMHHPSLLLRPRLRPRLQLAFRSCSRRCGNHPSGGNDDRLRTREVTRDLV
jgi:hypothetical protein